MEEDPIESNPFFLEVMNKGTGDKLCCLSYTLPLEEIPPDFAALLNRFYESNLPIERMLASVFNSIYAQKRIIFTFTREGLEELMKSDVNQLPITFNVHYQYRKFLKVLLGNKHAKMIFAPQNKRQLAGYSLTFKALRSLIVSEYDGTTHKELHINQQLEFEETFRPSTQEQGND